MLATSLQPECSLANAALVPDSLVLHAAAYKALAAQQRGGLRTKSLHAELVVNLSGSKHVSFNQGSEALTACPPAGSSRLPMHSLPPSPLPCPAPCLPALPACTGLGPR